MFNFNYDPQRQGYDPGVWKTIAGTPSISGSNLLLNAAGIVQLADCFRGSYNFKLTLPSAPANGYLTGGTAATSVAATWAAVTDGEFAITIDGTARDITGIDFTGLTTMPLVAAKIQTAIRAVTSGLETVAWSTNKFVITGRISVSVTSAVSGGSGTDISGAGATTFLDAETGKGTPTAGTNKVFGLTSLNKGIKAIFNIYGEDLRCITLDDDGVTNTTIIPWVSSWSSASALFQVRWYGTSVSFFVNETQVASFNENIPTSVMSQYLYNYNSDNLTVVYTEGMNLDTYIKSQINVNVNVSDIEIGAVEIKDGASDVRQTVNTIGSKGAAAVQILDASGNQITSFGSPSTIADYRSPKDFTATFTTTSTLTLTGLPFTLLSGVNVVYIKVRKSATNLATVYVNGAGGYSFGYSAGVLTVYKDGVASAVFTDATDMLEIGINDQQKAYDLSTDTTKVINQSPDRSSYVQDSLVDTTNVGAGTVYYPAATGMSMDGFKDMSLTGKIIEGDAVTDTISVEGTNDEDTTNADWVAIYGYDSKANAMSNLVTTGGVAGTYTFAWDFDNLNYTYYRVKLVVADSTNTVIIKMRRKSL
jgi:hypothetical protein